MTGRTWRDPLPIRACLECGVAQSSCEASAMFSGRRCCPDCDHGPDEGTAS